MNKNQITILREQLENKRDVLKSLLPEVAKSYVTPERIIKIVLLAVSRQPLLLQCTTTSIIKAVMEIAPLGLEIAGPMGHVYLVPFKNKNGIYEAVPIPGYRGYIELAYRSGKVLDIFADVVYRGDSWTLRRTVQGDDFVHEPKYQSNKNEDIIRAYCLARFTNGGHHLQVMTIDEIMAIKNRSKAGESGPWVTDFVEMAKKTVVRRAFKYWNIGTPAMAQLAEIDSRVDTGEYLDMDAEVITPTEINQDSEPATKKLLKKINEQQTEKKETEPEQQISLPTVKPSIVDSIRKKFTEIYGEENALHRVELIAGRSVKSWDEIENDIEVLKKLDNYIASTVKK